MDVTSFFLPAAAPPTPPSGIISRRPTSRSRGDGGDDDEDGYHHRNRGGEGGRIDVFPGEPFVLPKWQSVHIDESPLRSAQRVHHRLASAAARHRFDHASPTSMASPFSTPQPPSTVVTALRGRLSPHRLLPVSERRVGPSPHVVRSDDVVVSRDEFVQNHRRHDDPPSSAGQQRQFTSRETIDALLETLVAEPAPSRSNERDDRSNASVARYRRLTQHDDGGVLLDDDRTEERTRGGPWRVVHWQCSVCPLQDDLVIPVETLLRFCPQCGISTIGEGRGGERSPKSEQRL